MGGPSVAGKFVFNLYFNLRLHYVDFTLQLFCCFLIVSVFIGILIISLFTVYTEEGILLHHDGCNKPSDG